MDRSQWFESKWRVLRRSAKTSLLGLIPVGLALALRQPAIAGLGVLFLLPLLFWLVLIPLLHWRERYQGKRVNLWGALLLLEVSGWLKLLYWFRHVLPDRAAKGRYSNAP